MSIVSNNQNQSEEPNYISDCDSDVQNRAAPTAPVPGRSSPTSSSSTRSTSNRQLRQAADHDLARVGHIRLKVRKEIQSRLEAAGSLGSSASAAKCAKRLEEILFSVHITKQEDGGSTSPSIDAYYTGSMRGRIKPLLVALLERKLRKHKQETMQSSKSQQKTRC